MRGGFEHPRVEVGEKALDADLYRSRGAMYVWFDLASRVTTVCGGHELLNLNEVLDNAGVKSFSVANRFDDRLHRFP